MNSVIWYHFYLKEYYNRGCLEVSLQRKKIIIIFKNFSIQFITDSFRSKMIN